MSPRPPKSTKPIGNQYFLLPLQPDPKDRRPRNAFGFLTGFGKAFKAFYDKRDKATRRGKHSD
jgi:hypothetical protein